MKPILSFTNISKCFLANVVLQRFETILYKGEVIAIVGPSGCGKTTLLNLATKVVTPTTGSIENCATTTSYVFQEPRLLPWCTLWENVIFSINEKVDEERILQLVRLVGLEEALHLYPRQLSGGMKQRVSILRAFACNPELILMDEPFSALDYSLKKQLMAELITLIDSKGVSALYVTHDYTEAATLADKIIQFKDAGNGVYNTIKLDVPRSERDFNYIKTIEYQLLKET